MPNIIYRTLTMIAAIQAMTPHKTFLRDRYFPTSPADIFPTDEVLIDYKDGNKKIAPVVAPARVASQFCVTATRPSVSRLLSWHPRDLSPLTTSTRGASVRTSTPRTHRSSVRRPCSAGISRSSA